MGIGRREFLKLTSLALAGVVFDPFKAVITNEDLYINKKLGVLFYKPKGWGFVHVQDFGRLKKEQILYDEWNDCKDEVFDDLGDPVCIATKYYQDLPQYKGVFSPTISLHVTPKSELKSLGFTSFEEIMLMSEFGVSQFLKEFTVLKKYAPYEISGCKFYEFDAEYLFEHVDIQEPLKIELKVLKAEHNNFYYDFNCHQSSAQNQMAFKEFEEFKNSIKMV